MMMNTRPVMTPMSGMGSADFTVDVNWSSTTPGHDPGWRWSDLPDQVGPTVLPSGPQGPGVPTSTLPSYLNPEKTGAYQQGSGGDGGLLNTGGVDIGLPGFGLGPNVNVNYPGKSQVTALSTGLLAVGAILAALVVLGQVK